MIQLTPHLNPEQRLFVLQCLQNKVITPEQARDLLFSGIDEKKPVRK